MRYQFTPAAQRALSVAADWSSCLEQDALDLPEVLLGLLSEPECRSALLLAPHGINVEAVRRQFDQLIRVTAADADRANRFSAAWLDCLRTAENLLFDYPRPLVLATEHLLLGLAASDNDVARWLQQRGLDVAALEAEVHRLAGYQPGPLPLEFGGPTGEETMSELPPTSEISALRVIDAAANRAAEGLRVIEDYLRFVLEDRHLTAVCKTVRHDLAGALEAFSSRDRHAARETQADIGTSLTLPSEQARADLNAVVAANFKRVEQALRSLEECCKVMAPQAAAALEQLRYRTYTLERAVDITGTSLERLVNARLYVLVDGRASGDDLQSLAVALVAAQVGVIQLRDKKLADRELLERARIVRAATQDSQTLFIMNDRPDLAVLSQADGVHVGQEELSVKDARRIVGPRALVGVSTHSIEQARAAVLDGADYIGVGPTFVSSTKEFSAFGGVELLRAVWAEIRLPAFAIGGIRAENLSQVLAAGFTRIAVGEAIAGADDPASAARRLLSLLAASV